MSVKVDGDAETGKFRFIPVVNYVYDVDSKIYDSHKIIFGHGLIFHPQISVDKFMEAYPPGEEVKIIYDPIRPQVAVFRRELEGTKASFITDVVLIFVILGMLLIVIKFLLLIVQADLCDGSLLIAANFKISSHLNKKQSLRLGEGLFSAAMNNLLPP